MAIILTKEIGDLSGGSVRQHDFFTSFEREKNPEISHSRNMAFINDHKFNIYVKKDGKYGKSRGPI